MSGSNLAIGAWTSMALLAMFGQISMGSIMHVSPGGIYDKVQLNVEEQPPPVNCTEFVANLQTILNTTSFGLFRLTGSGRLSSVEVTLPASWWPECRSAVPSAPRPRRASHPSFSAAELSLVGSGAGFGSLRAPWAEQFGGCGVAANRVHIPRGYFDGDQDMKERGLALLREWGKFRYGVFPERGSTDGDARLYPHLYNEGNKSLVSVGCDDGDREELNPFCPLGKPYNRGAPTKQNLLCRETSAIETIMNHKDFKVKPNDTVYEPPTISFFAPRPPRFTVVLERTSTMGAGGRWTSIKRALFRFFSYLPPGAEVSVVTYGKEAQVNLSPTAVSDANREGLHGRIPRKVLRDDLACLYCALNLTLEAMGDERGAVVLVTGSPRQPQQLDALVEQITESSVPVFPIVYPGTAYPDVARLAVHGKTYAVPEGADGVQAVNYLSEVLIDVLHRSSGGAGGGIQKVHQANHKSTGEFAGTFTVGAALSSRMSVTLSVDDEERVEFFEITSPSGGGNAKRSDAAAADHFSKFEDGMVVFSHPGEAEPGIWTYHAKLYPQTGNGGANSRVSVDVVSQQTQSGSSSLPVVLEAFTSADQQGVDVYKRPVIVYARLTQGRNMPILNARVTAFVFRPGQSSQPIELTLRDDGGGDVDVTAGDGVYSAAFSAFNAVPGFYALQVAADDNGGLARTVRADADSENQEQDFDLSSDCCGRRFPLVATLPSSPFSRQTAGAAFHARQGLSPSADVAPPGRILDLRVAGTTTEAHAQSAEQQPEELVRLEWTAPGGDYDQGKASSYELRCHSSRSVLTNGATFASQGILVHSSLTPAPEARGRRQSVAVAAPWPDQTFYYAMVAVDGAGNRSPVSNVVSIYVRSREAALAAAAAEVGRAGANGTASAGVVSLMGGVDSHRFRLYLAAAAGAGLVLLAIALVVVIFARARAKRRRDQRRSVQYDSEEKDTYRTYEPRPPPAGKAASDGEGSATAATKSLSTWLDSLPRSEHSPNTTSHDLSLEQGGTLGRHRPSGGGNHTLTKTNPYRHKVLTNGSFLNLKDAIPNGSNNSGNAVPNAAASGNSNNDDSSRPTTSTEDNGSSSQGSESGEFHQQQQQQQLLQRQLQQRLYPRDDLSVHTLPANGNKHYGGGGGHVIDTSTAKAIIDTYSGNLFSSGSGGSGGHRYHSFRGYSSNNRQPDLSVEVGQSSLEVVDRSLSSYPQVMPEDTFYDNGQQQQQQPPYYVRQYEDGGNAYNMHQHQSAAPPPPIRPRTESVV